MSNPTNPIDKKLRFYCNKCKVTKPTRIVVVYDTPGDKSTAHETEVIREVKSTIETEIDGQKASKTEVRKVRLLDCGHNVLFDRTPGFPVPELHDSDNLSESDIQVIRSGILGSIIGLQAKELEERILRHAEEYQTLLKIATKQAKQAKYVIQLLDDLREKYGKQLEPSEARIFEQKFRHFTQQDYTVGKVIERERTKVEKEKDKQKAAIEEMKALLMKKGFDPKTLFGKSDNQEGEQKNDNQV